MKKNSKVIGVTLILAAFALMSLGSGSSSSAAKETKAITQEKTDSGAAAAETEAEAAAETEAATEAATEATQDAITIEEQLLVDQDGLKITAKEYTVDPIWGPGIKLLIENDSDKNYGISCNALVVNNYMVSDIFSKSVAPGKKANETLNFLSADLKNAGIEVMTGSHSREQFSGASLVIPSPGMPLLKLLEIMGEAAKGPDAPEIMAETEFAYRHLGGEGIAAVTGTSGKTTTVSLIAAMLRERGKKVFLGGNIGTPLSEYILGGEKAWAPDVPGESSLGRGRLWRKGTFGRKRFGGESS